MKVILNRDIKNLGKVCDICDVKDGYGRNFLLPNNYAIMANESNIKKLEEKKEVLRKENEKLIEGARKLSNVLSGAVFNVVRQAADDGTIYGSIKVRDIYQFVCDFASKNNVDFSISNSAISLPCKINALGQYVACVNIFGDIVTNVRLNVCRTTADYLEDATSFDERYNLALSGKDNKGAEKNDKNNTKGDKTDIVADGKDVVSEKKDGDKKSDKEKENSSKNDSTKEANKDA